MSSILDHVEQAVPRATVYGAMKGSPVFIGKYFREVHPASNATAYDWGAGERRITFVVASPDKTVFNDMRSVYLKCNIRLGTTANDLDTGDRSKLCEPASNCIERIVIKMNGTVVEDISNLDRLQSLFKRALLNRSQKNARSREGWDYVGTSKIENVNATAVSSTNLANAICTGSQLAVILNGSACKKGERRISVVAGNGGPVDVTDSTGTRQKNAARDIENLCLKLDLSGIMNCQQLLSGYYSPLEIDLYLQDPAVCCQASNSGGASNGAANISIKKPRLCMEQVVMSPEYVSAFESALLANSSAQGIQIPFTTYYTYKTNITRGGQDTFWVRRPVRYLKGVYFGCMQKEQDTDAASDSYRFSRQRSTPAKNVAHARTNTINKWQISIGTKNYREIDDSCTNVADFNNHESQVMFAKAVGHYNDYTTETDEYNGTQRKWNHCQQGIDLEFSPDNDVLASETTLNSNDVRLKITTDASAGQAVNQGEEWRCYVMLQYQASIALFPGNETRLLVT